MKKIRYIIFFVFLFTYDMSGLKAQGNVIYKEIQNHKYHGENFERTEHVFQKINTTDKDLEKYFKVAEHVTYLDYDNKMLNNTNAFVSIDIPYHNGVFKLDLIDVSDKFYDYKLVAASGKECQINTANRYYRGVVNGNTTSLVAISFFENNVIGVISTAEGNFNISKLKNSNQWIIYNDANLDESHSFECGTDDTGFMEYDPDVLSGRNTTSDRALDDCIKIYFETEYDIFVGEGSIVNVENYVAGLFNVVATIYQNESISIAISEIKVWDIVDPYTATNIHAYLTEFQTQTASFNGDLGQLLTSRNVNGGKAAGYDGICNANSDESLSVSGGLNSFNPFPTFSWDVFVVTHEFGHLFGSRHTHACVWNGNNTAIDGCAGYVEYGGCPLPPNPPSTGQGTIMSYCHAIGWIGINFSLGFGLQPGNVIRNVVTNATCLNISCCSSILNIMVDVTGGVDNQEASSRITASNTIGISGTAVYHAGNEVLLRDGFTALDGSVFRGYIEGCSGNFVKSATGTIDGSIFEFENQDGIMVLNTKKESGVNEPSLLVTPNPNNGSFRINLNHVSDGVILIVDLSGKIVLERAIDNQNEIQINLQGYEVGLYTVQVILNNGVLTKKIIIN